MTATTALGCGPTSSGPPPVVATVAPPPPATEVVTVAPSPPSSDDVPSRSEPPQATFRAPPAPDAPHADLTPGAAAKLPSGVPVDVVVEVEVMSAGKVRQLVPAGECRVTYDLWDEVYRLVLPSARSRAVTTTRAVVDACTDSRALQLAKSRAPSGATVRRIVRQK